MGTDSSTGLSIGDGYSDIDPGGSSPRCVRLGHDDARVNRRTAITQTDAVDPTAAEFDGDDDRFWITVPVGCLHTIAARAILGERLP